MPHDANGHLLSPGDEVTIRFKVTHVGTGDKDCNVTLQAIDVADSGQTYLPILSCNTKLAEKVGDTSYSSRPWPEEQASYVASRPY